MSLPLSRLKSISTATELALVKASRPPELNQHTLTELKRLVTRARRMMDKQQGLGRAQGRTHAKQGVGAPGTTTALKEQMFRDALDAFEGRLQTLTADGSAAPAANTRRTPPKPVRAAQHREARAKVRRQLAGTAEDLAAAAQSRTRTAAAAETTDPPPTETPTTSPPAGEATPSSQASGRAGTTRRGPVARDPAKAPGKKKRGPASGSAAVRDFAKHDKRQLSAADTAKQKRIAASGLTTRVRGHVAARGKRSQARRDR